MGVPVAVYKKPALWRVIASASRWMIGYYAPCILEQKKRQVKEDRQVNELRV